MEAWCESLQTKFRSRVQTPLGQISMDSGPAKGHLNTQKDPVWYPAPVNGAPSILIDNDENHSKGRRLLSHAFSDKALHEQESLIQNYVDQLVHRLKETTSENSEKPVDLTKWYNWTTFDVIADLLFGEPFGCLQDMTTHKHIKLLFDSVKSFRFCKFTFGLPQNIVSDVFQCTFLATTLSSNIFEVSL